MAEAETKEAHTPDWSVVGPDLLAAAKYAVERFAMWKAPTTAQEDALEQLRAAIQRAEA